MALTKVTGDFIKDGVLTQAHLHTSHGITTAHIGEGSNLYFTNARVDSRIGDLSTSNLSEGSNLYYTNARARAAISVSGNALSYNSSTGVITSNFEESPTFTGDVLFQGGEEAIKIIGSGNQSMLIGSTGTGFAGIYMDASNGDFAGSDYVFIGQDDDKTFRLEAYSSAGDILFRESGSDTLRLSSNNATLSGDLTVSGGDITLGGTGRIQGIDTVSANTDAANKLYVDNQVAGIVDSAPSTLDTLNELAAALGDDANFSTTVTNNIATKMPLAGGTFTGFIQLGANQLRFDQSGTRSWTVSAASGNLNINSGDSLGNVAITSGLTIEDTAIFNGGMTLPSASHDLHIGHNLSTTGQIVFGHSSWNNSLGLESYWMVLRTNQNEGLKLIDSVGNTYVQFNASNNSSGAYDSTFKGNIITSGVAGDGTPLLTLTGSASATFNWISKSLHANLTAGETNLHLFGKAASTKNSGYIGYNWAADASNNNYVSIGHYSANHLFRVYGDQVLSTVTLRSDADMQAPTFYDKNNTSYYLHPDSSSNLLALVVQDNLFMNAGQLYIGAANGTTDDTYRMYESGGEFIWQSRESGTWTTRFSISNGGAIYSHVDHRAPVFYDSNNTAYYFDGASTTNANQLTATRMGVNPGGSSTTRYGISLYDGYASGEPTYGLLFTGTSGFGGHGGITSDWATYFTMNNNNARGWIFRKAGVGNTSSITASGLATFDNSVRSPIFYDSNDTAYYVDPATGSNLKGIVTNTTSTSAVGNQLKVYSTSHHQYPQIHSNANLEAMWNYKNTSSEWYVGLRTSGQLVGTTGFHFYNTSQSQTVGGWDVNGHSYSIGSSRAPVFYDSANTAFYCDADSTSYLSKIWTRGSTTGNAAPRWDTSFHVAQSQHFYGHSSTQTIYHGEGGNTYQFPGNGGVRSQTFYDYNNTGFYLNGNGFSNLHSIGFDGVLSGGGNAQIGRNHAYDTLELKGYGAELMIGAQHTSININYRTCNNNASNNTPHTWYWRAGSPSNWSTHNFGNITSNGTGTATGDFRAPIFYDSGDTAYYANLNSTSHIRKITGVRTNLATAEGWGEVNAWNTGNQTGYFGGDFTINGSSNENNISWEDGPSGTRSANKKELVWKVTTNSSDSGADGGWNKTITGIDYNKSHISILYVKRIADGNGNFYHGTTTCLNLNGTTNTNPYFQAIGSQSLPLGVWCVSIGFLRANNDTASTSATSWSGIYRLDTGERIIGATDFRLQQSSTSQHRCFLYYATNTATELWFANPGFYEINGNEPKLSEILMRPEDRTDSLRADVDMRAPIFYDSNNTGYYTNPASTSFISNLNMNGHIEIRRTDPTIYFRDTDHNSAMLHTNSNIFYILRGGNDSTSWSTVNGYWPLEVNLTNNQATFGGIVQAITDMRAPVFYDSNDTNYYCNPNGTSKLATVEVGASGYSNIWLGGQSGNYFRFHTNNSHTYFDGNVGDIHWRQGSSTRFIFYMTTANMTVNGTVTQNSDERIKDNIITIDGALDKVNQLRGVYYNRTDINTSQKQIGLIAQEVESVIPEVVLTANDELKTKSISYAQINALLIEAIKEQQTIIDDLKSRIETLENQ